MDNKPRFMLPPIPWVSEQPQRTNSGECKNSEQGNPGIMPRRVLFTEQTTIFSSYCDVVLSVTQSYCDSASLYTSILDQGGVCRDSSGSCWKFGDLWK